MVVPSHSAFQSSRNFFFAVVSEILAPVLRIWAGVKTREKPTPPEKWRKVLLFGAQHIGDILYRTCALEQLSKEFPQFELHIVATFPASDVLAGNPSIRKIHKFEAPSSSADPGFGILKQECFDAIICYDSGMFWRSLMLAVELGIPNRVGYIHKGFSAWVTRPVPIRFPQPFPAYFRDLINDLCGSQVVTEVRPRIHLQDIDTSEAEVFERSLQRCGKLGRIAVFATTRQPTMLWPIESYADLIKLLIRAGYSVTLCGEERDRGSLEAIRDLVGEPCDIAAGALSIKGLAAFIKSCAAIVGPDSGPRHIANAVNTPVFYFRNLRSDPVETGSYCSGEVDLVQLSGNPLSLEKIQPRFVAEVICETLSEG